MFILFASNLQVLGFSKRTINTYFLKRYTNRAALFLDVPAFSIFLHFHKYNTNGVHWDTFFGVGNLIEMKLDRTVTLQFQAIKKIDLLLQCNFLVSLLEGFQEDFNTINFITPSLFL